MSKQTVILDESRALNGADLKQLDTNYIIYGDYTLAIGISIPTGCVCKTRI